ncbi:transcription factor HIVEP3 [Salvelinus sp. IW2-2015]|uniref:transcription factor HIVEP3 n=1 Tax=Salvelinus sp. IW2-2015 TaxID=2691554 RepID=UPI0038D42AD9
MEAEPSHPADGERSGRQQQPLSAGAAESPTGSCPPQPQQPPSNPRPIHGGLGCLHHRKPKRSDLLLMLQHQHKTQAAAWQLSTDTPGPSGGSISSPSTSSLQSSSTQGDNTQGVQSQPNQEAPEGSPSKRSERKPQKPGKYVCTYCGRPCAKPSVLQKHIRSHTGERPYPCVPCGFSFKTKSNLYKHRKSHTHRIKAGLASSRDELSLSGPAMSAPGEDPEEPTEGESTDSESSSGQYRKERLGKQKSSSSLALLGQEEGQRSDNSQAVKQRLAMRLSERKRGPMASPEDPPSSSTSSSLGPSSKGSQESGYFSLSRSTEMSRADSQVSPPTAKTYAEIILGKYGRLGGQQRGPHHQHAHSSPGMEEKSSMPFSVPKTQVIEHITKLITVNEAVVDTSEIDSVKPRRSSLSRKSSLELPKFSCPKDPYMFEPKGESPSSSMAGQSFFPHVQDVDPSGVQESSSSVPLLRSHSMPTSASQGNHSTTSPWGFCRLSHSFDEQQAVVAEMRVGGQHRLLRRQPAIEVPLGAELSLEEAGPSYAATESGLTRKLQQQQQQQRKGPRLYECKARCKQRESYEAHRGLCTGQPIKELERGEVDGACRDDRPQMMHYKFRALAMAVRKRRKEESLEEDPPSPGPTAVVTCSPATTTAVPSLVEQSEDFSGALSQAEQQQQDRKGISVIQHTSSFEKQESICMESQESIELSESQSTLQKQPQPKSSRSMSRLVRQHNIQVPEILVTVEPDADMVSVSPTVTASSSKEPERVVEEFQWPQRSQSMAQLPAEKLRKPEAGEDEEKQPERAQIGVVTVKVEEEEKVRDPEGHREEREMQGKAEPKKEKGREKNESWGVSASFVTQSPERAKAPSYTSLHTTTSVSWCYLNYVKPNPSAQRESQTSVYTSWSVSMHNPNLPGLSTKLALSLLSSKQKHSSETYTMATALTPATGKVVSASSRKTYISEVHAIPPSTPVEVKEPPQQPEKGKREEQGPSTSKQSEPLCVKILEGGYKCNEEYVYVRGRGRGNYVCGECGIRCKKPSMLRKHIRTHTDLRPYICKHCNFAFKTKGNLTKHMKSKAHGKKCQSMGTSGSSLDEPETEEAGGIEEHLSGSEDQDEHQFSDVDDSEEDDDEEEEESSSHDELPSSCSSDRSLSARGHSSSGRRTQQGTPDPSAPELQPDPSPCPSQELSPSRRMWPSGHASSPESRRALFSCRGWDASPRAFSPSSESCSPIRSISPRRELASHNRHLSPSPKRGPSPIRALSPLYPMRPLAPLRPMSPSQYRVLWARASPSPLEVQHRPRSSPSRLPWDIPSLMASDRRQVGSMERIGTPSEGQIGPEPCLSFPPAFQLSPSDSPKAQSQSMDRIFSHLPLHSQQARVPYLMISIGGIQMVQARPRSHPTTPTLASSPPMEGLLLGQTRREAPWCRTPRTQGLRTPGDHWSDSQEVVGASQSGLCIPSLTPPIHSKPSTSQQGRMDSEMINTKQYHSSSHSHRSEAETRERWPSHGQAGPSPPPTHRIGQLFERQEPPGLGSRATGSELVEGGAKGGDSTNQDQST